MAVVERKEGKIRKKINTAKKETKIIES